MKTRILTAIIFFSLWACKHDSVEEFTEESNGTSAQSLEYKPDVLTLITGSEGKSSAPTASPSENYNYSITVNPSNDDIGIDPNGQITINNSVPLGTYLIDVSLTNAGKTRKFANAFKVNIIDTPIKPSDLTYSPNSGMVTSGIPFSSILPSVNGTAPFTYSLTTIPSTPEITISDDGIINATTSLANVNYKINVTVSNLGGSITYNNIYQIIPNVKPSNLVYSPNALSTPLGSPASSTTPSVDGTAPFSYSITTSPSTSEITISDDGTINTSSSLPSGTYQINVIVSNLGGSLTYNKIYTITTTAAVNTTFTNDILPIINSKCGLCHINGGSQLNWKVYNNTKTNIVSILDRIQRAEGSVGAMPATGGKLSTTDIAKFQKWLDDGLIE